MDDKQIGLIGAGGQAREIASYFNGRVAFNAVDPTYVDIDTISIYDLAKENKNNLPLVIAIGAPGLRKRLFNSIGNHKFTTVISKNASITSKTLVGEGTVLADGVVVTTDVSIGRHSLVNVGVTISHNVTIGDFCTLSPGVNIAGNVKIGDGVFVGIGATISNDISIANGAVIGAGAVVLKDIDEQNAVCVGVPARVVSRNKSWLDEI